ADVAHVDRLDRALAKDRLELRALFANAMEVESDAEPAGAVLDDPRCATGEERHLDADAAEKLDAESVLDREALDLLAALREADASVREDAVDVGHDESDSGRRRWNLGAVSRFWHGPLFFTSSSRSLERQARIGLRTDQPLFSFPPWDVRV